MYVNQYPNEFKESSTLVLPLVHNFHLHMKTIDVPNYRNIPLVINDYGKVTKSFLHKKSDSTFLIYALSWKNIILIQHTYLYHFNEILSSYVHNHLHIGEEYIILNKACKFGIRLTINQKSKQLDVENFDRYENKFIFIESLNKIECRILIRMFFNYLNKGEVLVTDDDFDGTTKCNYANNPFYLKVLE